MDKFHIFLTLLFPSLMLLRSFLSRHSLLPMRQTKWKLDIWQEQYIYLLYVTTGFYFYSFKFDHQDIHFPNSFYPLRFINIREAYQINE